LEDTFLAVDKAFDHAAGFLYLNQSEVFEFFKAVYDVEVFERGFRRDSLDVVVAVLDAGEDGAIFLSVVTASRSTSTSTTMTSTKPSATNTG